MGGIDKSSYLFIHESIVTGCESVELLIKSSTVTGMSNAEDQEAFCETIWEQFVYDDSAVIHDLRGDRNTGEVAAKTFVPTPLDAFTRLPIADQYLAAYHIVPHAVLRLGKHALIAATVMRDRVVLDEGGRVKEKTDSILVSLEHDRLRSLSLWKSHGETAIDRNVLVDATDNRYDYMGVSRMHATVRANAIGLKIADLGSLNGTQVAVDFRTQVYGENQVPELVIPTDWEREFGF
jgi:hypothetical protein